MKKISILIPLYNKEKYIEETLYSIDRSITKDLFNIQLIIVDDLSTDNSLKLVEEYKWKSNVELIIKTNSENKGPANSFNYALSFASGDYVVPLDADDILLRLGLFTRFEFLEKNLKFGWVSGNELFMNLQGNFTIGREFSKKFDLNKEYTNEDVLELYFKNTFRFGPHTLMLRREVLEKSKWLTDLRSSQDAVFILELLLSDFQVGFIDDYVAVYRNDDTNNNINSLFSRSVKSGQKVKDLTTARNYYAKRLKPEYLEEFDRRIAKHQKLYEQANNL